MGFCSKGLKKEFETAKVNEPSVFEPLKFYCIMYGYTSMFSAIYAKGNNCHFLLFASLDVIGLPNGLL